MILDSEIILVDTISGELLPFGSLGAHKKKEYPNAEVCLFVFDCILYKGEDLTNLYVYRRFSILCFAFKFIQNYFVFTDPLDKDVKFWKIILNPLNLMYNYQNPIF